MDEKACNPSLSGRKLITHNICLDDIRKKKKGQEFMHHEQQEEDEWEAQEPLNDRLWSQGASGADYIDGPAATACCSQRYLVYT